MIAYEEPIPLTELELTGFHRILKTTPVQQTAAKALLDASIAELKTAEGRAAAIGQRYFDLPKERRTPEVRDRMNREQAASAPDVPAARRQLLHDLKALLTAEQLEQWRSFEMFLRRETWRTDSRGIVRHRVNLLALVDALGPDVVATDSLVAADAALARYERELDLLIIEADRLEQSLAEAQSKAAAARRANHDNPDASNDAQTAALNTAGAEFNAANRRILLFNDSSVEAFGRLLTPEPAAALRVRYKHATLPEAYRPNATAEAIRLAPRLPGLDEPTRDRLGAVAREFALAYDALCDRIGTMEHAIHRAQPGTKPNLDDWDPVRMKRQELLVQTTERIKDMVTEEQYQAIQRAGSRAAEQQTAASSR